MSKMFNTELFCVLDTCSLLENVLRTSFSFLFFSSIFGNIQSVERLEPKQYSKALMFTDPGTSPLKGQSLYHRAGCMVGCYLACSFMVCLLQIQHIDLMDLIFFYQFASVMLMLSPTTTALMF